MLYWHNYKVALLMCLWDQTMPIPQPSKVTLWMKGMALLSPWSIKVTWSCYKIRCDVAFPLTVFSAVTCSISSRLKTSANFTCFHIVLIIYRSCVGLWFDLEISYSGSFLMTLETKMNLARLGKEGESCGEQGKEG